jgi:hypothetical protein
MTTSADHLRGQIIEHCEQLVEHVKLLRDYATTPDNVWLARGELNQINEQVGEVEGLLAQLKKAD